MLNTILDVVLFSTIVATPQYTDVSVILRLTVLEISSRSVPTTLLNSPTAAE
jgi:hypothetical protein